MKHAFTKFLTPTLLSLATASFAQDTLVIDDFENGLKKWSGIENVSFQIVDNPSPDAVNNSSKVLKCTRKSGTKNWAGVILRDALTANINADESGYSYATVKFKKESRGNVSFKLESGPGNETFESTVAYPGTNDWTTVTFDLKSALYGSYADFFVMVDRAESLNSDITIYIDDITLLKTKKLEEVNVDPKAQKGTGEKDGYHLVWQDLFDNNMLDNEAWNVEVRNDGGGNNELQYYIKENVSVGNDGQGNGCLIITAKRQNYGNKNFTSGRLTTQNKVRFCHGKLEASIRLPKTANGLWPAFWLLGNDIQSNNWPNCGEIDVIEFGHSDAFNKGTQDRYFNGACHWGPKNGDAHPNYSKSNTWNYSLQDGEFHLYTMYWDEQKIAMYVDQDRFPDVSPYYELNISDKSNYNSAGNFFHHEFFILFNLAVGGDFSHIYDANGITALAQGEAKMYVNYVKIYQKGISEETYNGPALQETETTVESIVNCSDKFGKSGRIFNASGIHIANYADNDVNELPLPQGIYIIAPDNGKAWKLKIP
ncbi:MAG: glycoside hydrolase family 16 protein [Paludibacteraceae bacterium]|nr:glycoside hydrolase family 16 protein [Paludibacteraceae bacterium]